MDITAIVEQWRRDPAFMQNVTSWWTDAAAQPEWADLPSGLHPDLRIALASHGIDKLYSHQRSAFDLAALGENIIISTGTASGKTLCYNLPVLDRLFKAEGSALYLFPTKALTQDQQKSLTSLIRASGKQQSLLNAIYDGDTPTAQRSDIRSKASIVLTNPDMLHQGLLPHHTIWRHFLQNLQFVIIDEVHTYRGVFGSHIANVLRRFKRVAAFYGSYPQFIMASATIGNPAGLASRLIEAPVSLIDHDGSPHGTRHYFIYNPPLVDEQLGLRKSAVQTGIQLSQKLRQNGRQNLIFARTRRTVEMILAYMRAQLAPDEQASVRGYRSGYLKEDRRAIEQIFKSGALRTVVATSALELGIDIGDLEAVILVGYPGSIATTRQRFGRAGRKLQTSLAVLIATPDAMDQYLANHPEYLTETSPETALINPDNLAILMQHLQCAAFELPFQKDETFGQLDADSTRTFLEMFSAQGLLNQQDSKYFWIGEQFPAAQVSLRSTTSAVVLLKVFSDEGSQVIGELDAASAKWLVHPEAIYLHDAETYKVESLDLENGLCRLTPLLSDYYTMPVQDTIIESFLQQSIEKYQYYTKSYGDLSLRTEINGYRKLRWLTNEVLGEGKVNLPPDFLETKGCWFGLSDQLVSALREQNLWKSDRNDYGPGWPALRARVLARDAYRCRGCGQVLPADQLHVHHIKPFKTFTNPELANQISNLVSLCPACHQQAELSVRVRSGLAGACNALRNIAPLLVMCDREDLAVMSDPRSVLTDGQPAIIVYDNIPGGMGLSEKLHESHHFWLERAAETIAECACLEGCPACVGPVGEEGFGGKPEALALLRGML